MNTDKKRFLGWQRDIIKFFWPYLGDDKPYIALLGFISLITTGSNTLLIWMIGKAINEITTGHFESINQTLFIIAGIVMFNMAIQFVYALNYQRASLRFLDRVRGELLFHIMHLSYPIYFKFTKGDLITRLNADVDRLLTFVFNLPLNILAYFVVLCVYLGMIVWINWQLAILAILMAPLFFLSQYVVGPKTGRASKKFTEEKAKLVSIEEQSLSNLRGISAFNSESTIKARHSSQFFIARAWALKLRMIRLFYNSTFTILIYFVAVVLIYSGISNIQSGQLELGTFISFLVYIRYLTNPVRGLASMPLQMQNNRVAADRVMEILKLKPEVADIESAKPLLIRTAKITLSNVTFSYEKSQTPVFSNLSTVINAGETVALVGASGSGKSTFAGLLLRFFNPQQGIIAIDDLNIKDVTLQSLRDQISIVWQEPLIINGTIRENLLLARPDSNNQQMIDACKSAFAWEFIEKLEKGLDTLLGTNGITLSAGQQQRLSIAQAFLRDTPILILDEATSALDSYSEQMLVEAIDSLRKNRTTLIIAHRFSSIRNANRVLYFNGMGQIITGSHEELTQQIEQYKSAVEWQLGNSR